MNTIPLPCFGSILHGQWAEDCGDKIEAFTEDDETPVIYTRMFFEHNESTAFAYVNGEIPDPEAVMAAIQALIPSVVH